MNRNEIIDAQNFLSREFFDKVKEISYKRYGEGYTLGQIRDVHNEVGGNYHFLSSIPGHINNKGRRTFSIIPDISSFGDEIPVIYKNAPKDLSHIYGTHVSTLLGHLPELEGYGLASEFGNFRHSFSYFAQKFNPENNFELATPEQITSNFRRRYNNDSVYVDRNLITVAGPNDAIIKQNVREDEYAYQYDLIMKYFINGALQAEQIKEKTGKYLHEQSFTLQEFVDLPYKDTVLSEEKLF